jgi:hypothetical protein
MKKTCIITIVILLLNSSVKAQKKFKFSSQNYIGILEGEASTSFQLQTINGLRYKTWFAGVGAGLDYYYYRSIPVFVSFSKFLSSPKTPLYFNADIGINFPWSKTGVNYIQYPGAYSSSLYWEGGFGYKFKLKKRNEGILLNLGYSYKHLINEREFSVWCLTPPCPVFKERYDYRLRRLSLKAGWMF